ncbi:MAG: DALR anticodon-binding domain-containing protein, partial [Cetobacterium sp.]
ERTLAHHLTQFPGVVLKAAETCRPNLLADYLFELSKKFNSFYNACQILNQEDKVLYSRLLLAERTSSVLKEGLNLLGIGTLERM